MEPSAACSPPLPFRPWPGELEARVDGRPSPRVGVLGHRDELRDLPWAALTSAEPEPQTDCDRASRWLALRPRTIVPQLIKTVLAGRRGRDADEPARALLWASHPALPTWWHRLVSSPLGRMVLPGPEHVRYRVRTAGPTAADGDIPYDVWATEDGLLGMSSTTLLQRLDAERGAAEGLHVALVVMRLARDPRPWPPNAFRTAAHLLQRMGNELQTRRGSLQPLLRTRPSLLPTLLIEHQQAWAALLVRGDLPPDVSTMAETALRPLSSDERLDLVVDRVNQTPDFAWEGRATPAAAVFRLLLDAQGVPESGADAGWTASLAEWLVGQLQPTPGLPTPPADPTILWTTLEQVPGLLLHLAAWMKTDAAEAIPAAIRQQCAAAVARVPAPAWRPLLLARDPAVRLMAIQMLGDRAAAPARSPTDTEAHPAPVALDTPAPPRAASIARPTPPRGPTHG